MKVHSYRFSKMTEAARVKLAKECVEWALTEFYLNGEDLTRYYLEKKSIDTYFYALRDDHGKIVGTTVLKLYDINYQGENVVVAKLSLGASPQYRGNKFALRCLVRWLLLWKARNPLKPLFLFSTLLHPVTYKLCCDVLGDQIYPFYASPENPKLAKMSEFLADRFGVEKSDSPIPFVYKDVFAVKETVEAVEYWLNSPRPDVRFYVENCPTYHISGDCLVVLSPIGLTKTLLGMRKTLKRHREEKRAGKKPKFSKQSRLFERRGLGDPNDSSAKQNRRKDDR